MQEKNINLIVSVIDLPVSIAIYKNKKLDHIIEFLPEEKTSDALPLKLQTLFEKYGADNINSIVYTNTPGSFMAIKVTYLFLITVSLSLNIKILAIDGFSLNQNMPIKAIGKMHFIKNSKTNKIELIASEKLDQKLINQQNKIIFPEVFDEKSFSEEIEPIYNLPAVF
jgi:tRNA A37 threonylcarbamoyladenosine modification protein TsaB